MAATTRRAESKTGAPMVTTGTPVRSAAQALLEQRFLLSAEFDAVVKKAVADYPG